MSGLYEGLLAPLMPDVVKQAPPTETKPDLRQQLQRVEQLKSQEIQISKIEARLAREKQFNRKVEINTQLREARAAYKAMTNKPLTED